MGFYGCPFLALPFALGDYAGFPGCGLLRLHSTFRHDLKIYASDEGRVQMTAAAFAKVHTTVPPQPQPLLSGGAEFGEFGKLQGVCVPTQRRFCLCLSAFYNMENN